MKKKLIAMLTMICLVVAMLPATALAASGTIWLGGVQMQDGDYLANGATAVTTMQPGESGYAYYKDGVLTLNNYNYEGEGYYYDYHTCLYVEGDLAIVLIGTNTLKNTVSSDDGITMNGGKLSISGAGILNIDAEFSIYDNKMYDDVTQATGNVVIAGATVNTTGMINTGAGISISDSVVNSAGPIAVATDVSISGSTVTAFEITTFIGNVNCSDSTVKLQEDIYTDGGNVTISNSNVSGKKITAMGDMSLSNSTVTMSGNTETETYEPAVNIGKNFTMDSGTLIAKDGLMGVWVNEGNITITGGSITASGVLYGIGTFGNMKITGGTVVAEATEGAGIFVAGGEGAGFLDISGAKTSVEAKGSIVAFLVHSGITIGEEVTILEPVDGEAKLTLVEAEGDSAEVYTIVGKDGTVATSAKLAHVHAAGADYKCDGTHHWNECVCGEKMNVAEHVYGTDNVCDTCKYTIYNIIAGANGQWTQNTDGTISITADGDFSKFTGVKVDDILIDASNYTAVSGSTVVTLKSEYLKTLTVGTHKITLVYTDGEATTNFEVKAPVATAGGQVAPAATPTPPTSPKTGNDMGWLWSITLCIAVIAGAGLVISEKKKRIR